MKYPKEFQKQFTTEEGQYTVRITLKKYRLKAVAEIWVGNEFVCLEEAVFSLNYWVKKFEYGNKVFNVVIQQIPSDSMFEFMCYCNRMPLGGSKPIDKLCELINDPLADTPPDEAKRIKTANSISKILGFLAAAVVVVLLNRENSFWWESLLHVFILLIIWTGYNFVNAISDKRIRRSLVDELLINDKIPKSN